MKIKLNLLPKSKERKIKNRKILKFIILQEIMILIITLLFFGAIKGVDAVAKYRLSIIDQELSAKQSEDEYVEIKKYEEDLKEVSAKVGFVKSIKNFNIDWVIVFNKLTRLLPQETVLTSISGSGLDLVIKGNAKNRDILIKMKENIESDSCFQKVDIPLRDIVLRENIEFEMNLGVNIKCFNGYEKK